MDSIDCIFCKKSIDGVAIYDSGYTGRKCPTCNLIYVSPRPTFPEILNLYSEGKAQSYAVSIIPQGFAKRITARHTLRILKKYTRNGCMLELGAGAGFFLDEAGKSGFDVCGIELNTIQSDFMRRNFKIYCEETPLQDDSFGGKSFDIIYHCNVLSHLYDPISEFRKINSKLLGAGIHIFETGNLGDVNKEYYSYYRKFGYPDHLFFFGESSIRKLLDTTGFELVKIYGYSKMGYNVLFKYLEKIKALLKHESSQEPTDTDNSPDLRYDNPSSDITLSQRLKEYLMYLLTYQVGYLIPKKGHPQTLIVVARKKRNLDG